MVGGLVGPVATCFRVGYSLYDEVLEVLQVIGRVVAVVPVVPGVGEARSGAGLVLAGGARDRGEYVP